jgi:hypothetical protein
MDNRKNSKNLKCVDQKLPFVQNLKMILHSPKNKRIFVLFQVVYF